MADLRAQDIITSVNTESVHSTPCQMCRRQFSKYTCPRCNAPYCSLTCFRSAPHGQCSEGFYREEVQSDIKTAPSSSMQERMQMMEVLKRFEETALEDEEEEGDDDELSRQLRDVDIDAISTEDLWELLSPEQRQKFLKALQVPSSELAQQLLASEKLQQDIREPWWDDKNIDGVGYLRPTMMSIPARMLQAPPGNGSSLLYNICGICITYGYVNRYFATSPLSRATDDDADAMRQTVSQLVPFLTDRKSKTLHLNVSSVIDDISSRLGPDKVTSGLLALMLRDASNLMRPCPITEIPQDSAGNEDSGIMLKSHPYLTTLLVLSDVAALFERVGSSSKHVCQKLTFYAAHIMSTPLPFMNVLADVVLERSKSIDKERLPVRCGTAIPILSPCAEEKVSIEEC